MQDINDLVKKMREGFEKIDTDELVKKLKEMLILYNKKELLDWISLTSILEGNEIYQGRFSFIAKIILSIDNKQFLNKLNVDEKIIDKIFQATEEISWDSLEDYIPRKNNKENIFGFKNKEYFFLPGGLDHPEDYLEAVPTRYFELLSEFKDSNLEKDFINLLEIQNEMINISAKIVHKQINNLNLPDKKSIKIWVKYTSSKKNIFLKLFPNTLNQIKPNHFNINVEIDAELIKNPLFEGKFYLPHLMLLSFLEKLKEILEKNIDEDKREKLKSQLKFEVIRNLTELIPLEGILSNFEVNGNHKIDLGFIFENHIYMFFLIEEKFNKKDFLDKMEEVNDTIKLLEKEFENKVKLKGKHMGLNLFKKFKPVFIPIIDNLELYKVYPLPEAKNSMPLSSNELRFIFEDMVDNHRSPIYLKKVIKKFHVINPISFFGFTDFYDLISKGGNYSFKFLKEHSKMVIYPHFWSETSKKRMKERIRMDYRPSMYKIPFCFKIKNTEENFYQGYNNISLHYFYLVKKNHKKIFTILEKNFRGEDLDNKIGTMIGAICSYLMLQLPEEFLNKSEEKILKILPLKEAIERGLSKEMQDSPLSILKTKNDELHLFFKSWEVYQIYLNEFEEFLNFIISILLKQFVKKDKLDVAKKILLEEDIKNNFKVGQVSTNSPYTPSLLNIPSHIDIFDTEIKILTFLKNNSISPGEYKSKKANQIIRKIYDYLLEELNEELEKFNLKSLIKFGLFEMDSIIRERNVGILNLIQSTKSEFLEETQKELFEKELQLRGYSPSLRFVMEQAVLNEPKGREEIDIEEWNKIVAIAMKIIELANISEILHKQSEFLIVKLKINLSEMASFDIIIKDNPLNSQIKESIENYSKKDVKIEDHFPKPKDAPENFTELFNSTLEEAGMGEISKQMTIEFGFSIPEYIQILNLMTHLEPRANRFGIIQIEKKELINWLNKKSSLDKKIIHNVINFSILFNEDKEEIEPWRINTRKNRLTIKPLIEIKNSILFSIESMILAEENVFKTILRGDWPYSKQGAISNELSKKLEIYRKKLDHSLEDDILDVLKNNKSFCEKRVCKSKNEKCFKNIEEKCPGEIDNISVHLDKKIVIVWEAKNMHPRFGIREIMNDLDEFTSKDGYIDKLNNKKMFTEKYLDKILDYYEIDEKDGWKVIQCIVFSSNSLIKNILNRKINAIDFGEINAFIEKH